MDLWPVEGEAPDPLVDFLQYRVERPEEAGPVVEAAARTAFDCDRAAAVLLTQRLIGAKVF